MNKNALAALGYFGLGQVEPAGMGRLSGPSRYTQAQYAPVSSARTMPGYPYGMRGLGDDGPVPSVNYPAAPSPQGLPSQSYFQLPQYFQHTYGYKDALAAAGLEFHTETFDLIVDPVAQSGAPIPAAGVAGSTVIATVRISQEADFVAEKVVEDHEPSQSNYTVQIFDNATNRALSNLPARVANVAGTAQRPRLWKPRLFRRNSDISLIFTNLDANNPITGLQFQFSGFKVFDPNALNLNNPQ